ncbi:uncharacterized protein LOC100881882 [Anopheles sinensis]|uniref:MADF domain-containing protein n=1 Tax=Anopheles sinensis TaxID=74873 RepID=A0A084VRR2_ANOSI|nr:uncharacterized protein LOC100881882 [Anopheles sinensis]
MACKETTLALIEDYRKLPILWSKKHPLYKHRETRVKHLKFLAKKYCVKASVMEKRIHNLRSQFSREHKEHLKKTKPAFPRRPWYGYEKMLFLQDDWQGVAGTNTDESFDDLSDADAFDMDDDLDETKTPSVIDVTETKLIPIIDVEDDSSDSLSELEADDTTPTVSSSSTKQKEHANQFRDPHFKCKWQKQTGSAKTGRIRRVR